MPATMHDLVGVKMAPAMARLLGTDGANGAPARMLQHVGMPSQLARLLGTDMPGGGTSVPMKQLCNQGMPWAQAQRLGV
jgi:hypothetical protein